MSDKQETVRVRIAVLVNPEGDWSALGFNGSDDESLASSADDSMPYGSDEASQVLYFVEADIPIPTKPEPQTIEGEVADE